MAATKRWSRSTIRVPKKPKLLSPRLLQQLLRLLALSLPQAHLQQQALLLRRQLPPLRRKKAARSRSDVPPAPRNYEALAA